MAYFRNPDLPQAASENDLVLSGAIDCLRLNAPSTVTAFRSDDRMPEERSEKRNHNNAKDKTPRVEIKACVVGGQPVGIAHAKLLGRPPASQPHQTLIKIS